MKQVNSFYRFILLASLSLLIFSVQKIFIFSDDLIIEDLSDRLSILEIQQVIDRQKEFGWLLFAAIPIVHFVKILFAATCLSIGFLIYELKTSFSDLLKVSINAEFITIVHPTIKVFWFLLIDTSFSLTDLKHFKLPSLVSFFRDNEQLENWEKIILSEFSLDNAIYFAALIYALKKVNELSVLNSTKIVLSSYGSGFLVWLLFRVYMITTL